jgi:hypothetical protein
MFVTEWLDIAFLIGLVAILVNFFYGLHRITVDHWKGLLAIQEEATAEYRDRLRAGTPRWEAVRRAMDEASRAVDEARPDDDEDENDEDEDTEDRS